MAPMIIPLSARPRAAPPRAAPAQPDALHRADAGGFAIGILGHLTRARWLVAAGVILIFLGALLFPLLANVTTENRPPPIDESRGDSGE